jgi:hypothetical protein
MVNIDLAELEKSRIAIMGGRSLVWLGLQLPKLTTRVQIPATAPTSNICFVYLDKVA